MDLGLRDAKAVVTGGSKGIGLATARVLAQEGCEVAIIARDSDRLQRVAAELSAETGRRIVPVAGDMSKPDDVERAVVAALDELGDIDVLVTCAGSSPGGLFESLGEDEWMSSEEPP